MLHQLGPAQRTEQSLRGVNPAAEAVGGLGGQVQGVYRAADVNEVPGSRLEQNVGALLMYLALRAAHDAADAQRAGRVGHQDGVGLHGSLYVVQGGHLLTRFGQAGDDVNWTAIALGAGAQYVVVEGVVGLAYLQHYVVAHVDDVADGAHAGQPQPELHPIR